MNELLVVLIGRGSCLKSSPQAGSIENKPPPNSGVACSVDLSPMFPRNSLPRQIFHPVPIALGEICKLCQIDGSAGIRDSELVGQTCRIPVPGFAPTDTQALTAVTPVPTFAVRALEVLEVPVAVPAIRPPAFELLSPSVVIRRRPQRPNPTGSA